MNMRFFLYLFLSGSVLAFLIAFIALLPTFKPHPKENVLSYNDVRGMAVESDGILYTLNFEQQNQVITALNKGEGFPEMQMGAPTVDKLIIYRFSQ
ncbi:MAG: hypothetical protein H0T62_09945 [Parachlamydiaceae bacterium]|nr:hypothetical protein [Parachlamydiaceae bacterium]